MRINFAHLKERSTTGRDVNFAVFDAKPTNNTPEERDQLLLDLILRARAMNLNVEVGALAYVEHGQSKYWGHEFVLDYLVDRGIPRMTHYVMV
jgi:hypothetical protein